ncbi:uncharacterized protein N7482_004822 [Penicillium canariense]|uniref:STEEP1 domain-containing protein n=1 Tax=Penicillium canariense TaxID=189055 RepID=A0A9W9I9F6_9EURO|nr:uncharacterized protein N7482_004822 [Penicillium canariense]KAJ5169228.1 hypothetical protein N7482_004822 [Penicillium canariense]
MADSGSSPATRLPIRTQHCRFCNHLLLATTRDLSSLPRRAGDSQDKALILPLENRGTELDEGENTEPQTQSGRTKHATLLLSTTIPDRRATLIRREDGIEKRMLLRCGRCRVVVGYYLDQVHWGGVRKERELGEEGEEERPPAMYVLPGAMVETDKMGDDGVGEKEWRAWAEDA